MGYVVLQVCQENHGGSQDRLNAKSAFFTRVCGFFTGLVVGKHHLKAVEQIGKV